MSAVTRANRLTGHLAPQPVAGSGSFLGHVPQAPPDAIFDTKNRYKKDTDPRKINLGIGAYRDDSGKPYVLSVVRKAEDKINALKMDHEYLPIGGLGSFCTGARRLLFGDSPQNKNGQICTVQTISGTGALRVAADFIQKWLPGKTVFCSNPTWGNHKAVFTNAGVPFASYRYWNPKGRDLDISGMLEDIKAAPAGSIILLHACAHNPTGVDPTNKQWAQIADAVKSRGHFAFFDSAYQGFATGDIEGDAYGARYFVSQGIPLLCCQSFAKNFGLYNERCGALHFSCSSPAEATKVRSQLLKVIRPMYSNPPVHGARIVDQVLNTPALYKEWLDELTAMSNRILSMRKALRGELEKLGTPGDWSHITSQIGMFSFTGLTKKQCQALKSDHHVYLLDNGRISMSGANTGNVAYLAKCIDFVVRNVQ